MGDGVLAGLALVDAHCHRLLADPVDPATFERCLTEADAPAGGTTLWDSPAGLAVRRWCATALDLPPHAPPADYLARRAELGLAEVDRRLLRAAGLDLLLVDTGLDGPELAGVDALARAAGAPVREVVRLEREAELLAGDGVTAGGFAGAYVERLAARTKDAVAVKSVAAYRHGFDLEAVRPSAADVARAAGEWLAGGGGRLDHPVLLRFLLWTAADRGLPIQLHAGFGDRDLALARSDPSLLQPWLAAVEPSGVAVVLLHCYPFHRQAGWLAAVFPHVFVDAGLTVGQLGARAGAVLGEFLELAPFPNLLFSTDAYRLPELSLVGAAQFRRSFGALLDGWIAEGAIAGGDAERIATQVGAGNARRVYRLD